MFYFVRHGETSFNARNLMCGSSNVPLTDKGIAQAQEAGEKLKDVKFDYVFVSPLDRAIDTAKQILVFHPTLDYVIDERIRERSEGYFEGLQEKYYPYVINRWKPDFDNETYKCDSQKSLYTRIRSFLDDIIPLAEDKNVLVVAHGGVGRMLRAITRKLPYNTDMSTFALKNCEILVFSADELK